MLFRSSVCKWSAARDLRRERRDDELDVDGSVGIDAEDDGVCACTCACACTCVCARICTRCGMSDGFEGTRGGARPGGVAGEPLLPKKSSKLLKPPELLGVSSALSDVLFAKSDEVDDGFMADDEMGESWKSDRKSTRLNSSHSGESRMPSSA